MVARSEEAGSEDWVREEILLAAVECGLLTFSIFLAERLVRELSNQDNAAIKQ